VTVDGAADERTGALFSRLDAIARDVGARVNVAKDSRLEATTVAALFPEYDDVGAALERFDPKRRFDSALRRRLGL
jgi:decaprenylphospho-beta-D-ribofuranose 2-oxidase